MQMNDEITHMGIVHAGLRLGLPRRVRGLIIGIDTDNVEPVEIAELGAPKLLQFAAEHQMQKLFLPVFRGHVGPSHIVSL
ncbi:msl8267 [Mesorhizobium japonicum MAFF 303099]|uniref:Msl8267 protein n=1 Tax=Mesorhizobium japonicum (strain LMG 29417 / CECT 9101 / MAFF 303099) TaxID=266835 RepID=Q983M0_RHILO|nr:msl8267 [Mesorhizobium japonicum MAFF 303099]